MTQHRPLQLETLWPIRRPRCPIPEVITATPLFNLALRSYRRSPETIASLQYFLLSIPKPFFFNLVVFLNGVRFFNQGTVMRPLEWLAKTGRLTTLRDVLYFIFDVNSQAPTFLIYPMAAARGTKTAIAAPPTGDVLDRRAAYRDGCTA